VLLFQQPRLASYLQAADATVNNANPLK